MEHTITINRKKAYPLVFAFSTITIIVRAVVFSELGLMFHLWTFTISLLFVPVLFEGMVMIHNWFGWLLPLDNRIFTHPYSVVVRAILQILSGIIFDIILGTIIFTIMQNIVPFQLPSALTSTFTKTFFLAAGIANVMFVSTVNLGLLGREFFLLWKKELVHNERLQRERAEVQFDNLKNQFNPHFLFNSLASLNSLITDNPELASQFVQQLSKVYRYVLQTNNDLVTLKTEITFVQRYVQLLETRFQEGLVVEWEISEEASEQSIVPVTLQVLLENAVKHNVIAHHAPLRIRVFDSNGYIAVANNVQKKHRVEDSNKQGLQRIVQLYQYLDARPVVIAEQNGIFCVKIPLLKAQRSLSSISKQ